MIRWYILIVFFEIFTWSLTRCELCMWRPLLRRKKGARTVVTNEKLKNKMHDGEFRKR